MPAGDAMASGLTDPGADFPVTSPGPIRAKIRFAELVAGGGG